MREVTFASGTFAHSTYPIQVWASGSGPSYESLQVDIERLVSMKAGTYKIPGYDREDIAQEIRLVAFKALAKYDAKKNHSTPFHFIARCVDNYLINLRRDNDAFLSARKLKEADNKTLDRLDCKRKVYYPASLSEDEFANLFNVNRGHEYDVHESVLAILPFELHDAYWLVIKHGQHAVPKQQFAKIKKVVIELYKDS